MPDKEKRSVVNWKQKHLDANAELQAERTERRILEQRIEYLEEVGRLKDRIIEIHEKADALPQHKPFTVAPTIPYTGEPPLVATPQVEATGAESGGTASSENERGAPF